MEGTNRPQTGGCLGNAVYIVVTPESCDTQSPAHARQAAEEPVPVLQRG